MAERSAGVSPRSARTQGRGAWWDFASQLSSGAKEGGGSTSPPTLKELAAIPLQRHSSPFLRSPPGNKTHFVPSSPQKAFSTRCSHMTPAGRTQRRRKLGNMGPAGPFPISGAPCVAVIPAPSGPNRPQAAPSRLKPNVHILPVWEKRKAVERERERESIYII